MSQTLNINLAPGQFLQSYHMSQGDIGRSLVANLLDESGAYSIPAGATVKIEGTKPSGLGFSVAGTVSGSTVTFTTTKEMTDEPGRIPAEVKISVGTTMIGTANIIMDIELDPHPDWTPDGSMEDLIPEAAQILDLLIAANQAAAFNIAEMARLKEDAEEAAESAAESAEAAAAVFSVVGNVAFSVLSNGQVRETWTEES